MMNADEKELRSKMLKGWQFLYQRGFSEGESRTASSGVSK